MSAVTAKNDAVQTDAAPEADERAIAAWLSRRTSLSVAWARTPSGGARLSVLRCDEGLFFAARDLALLDSSLLQK